MDRKCINTLRILSADMVQKANSGHPGMALGCAPLLHTLFSKIMNHSSDNDKWYNRDRFIMSNGHGSALLYSTLHLCGYKITINDLENFRKIGSITPGHPEKNITHGVEVTTGPLGQGFANGVGMAIASKHLASRFNTEEYNILNNKIYILCGDGCLMEGMTNEAASLAGHLNLNNLVVLYDNNGITIDGSTNLAFTEDTCMRFRSLGWSVIEIEDGDNNIEMIEKCLLDANNIDNPVFISVKTTIGYGSDKENSEKSHGAPLGNESVQNLKEKLGFDSKKNFNIADDVKQYYKEIMEKNEKKYSEWNGVLEKYSRDNPEKYDMLKKIIECDIPDYKKMLLPEYELSKEVISTRKLSGRCLVTLGNILPQLMGGSADLTPSNNTFIDRPLNKSNYSGRYIHYGVREHAMCAIANGLSTYGLIPYVGTFLIFTNYCLGAIRLSALSGHHVIYVLTHDSIALGEDGPTHQPIESLTILRSIPNLLTLRPADGSEVSGAYAAALENKDGPSCICLSRQNLPQIENTEISGVFKGGYTVYQEENDVDLILISSGSEVSSCIEACKILKNKGKNIRVVSMVCVELYDKQLESYKKNILPDNIQKISVEAGSTVGWFKYADNCIGIDEFGMSGTGNDVMDHFNLTSEKIGIKICEIMGW